MTCCLVCSYGSNPAPGWQDQCRASLVPFSCTQPTCHPFVRQWLGCNCFSGWQLAGLAGHTSHRMKTSTRTQTLAKDKMLLIQPPPHNKQNDAELGRLIWLLSLLSKSISELKLCSMYIYLHSLQALLLHGYWHCFLSIIYWILNLVLMCGLKNPHNEAMYGRRKIPHMYKIKEIPRFEK